MSRALHFILKLLGGLTLAALVAGLFGIVVQHLWNWLMPTLFHLPSVTFWQAAGLVLLGRLLFGNVGGHHGHGKKKWRKWKHLSHCKEEDRQCGNGGWKHYGRYWKEEGKAHFEIWKERNGGTGRPQ